MIDVRQVQYGTPLWDQLLEYAAHCSWIAGGHLASMMYENRFEDWEAVFAAMDGGRIVGYCTFLKTDYYPENRYSPWISSIFVDEAFRGRRISQIMIDTVIGYACSCGFSRVYIPSDMTGFYEKFGFYQIDTLENYGGDIDTIFARDI